ncbi:MAG: glucosidase [Myxococcota bacterium]
MVELDPERRRLEDDRDGRVRWKEWGPYPSERQWGTVREDYSAGGAAWDYFPHDHARSRAYRWGEDGLAAFSDSLCRLNLGVALWNGQDPILKERLFGLTGNEGNHAEDVKELYYYVDATPTHSYLKMVYKYPQHAFPYGDLLAENGRRRSRGKTEPEYELIDTGVFDDDRYFDVEVEYAKVDPETFLWRITVHNRGPEDAEIHVLPQVWFRNTWSWDHGAPKPHLEAMRRDEGAPSSVLLQHPELGDFVLELEDATELLFCENETNAERLFGMEGAAHPKDAFHRYVVNGETAATNPAEEGTKTAGWYRRTVPAGGSTTVRACLRRPGGTRGFERFDADVAERIADADAFYGKLQQGMEREDARLVQRQALAGMIWSKQLFLFDVRRWFDGDPTQPAPPPGRSRNHEWEHLNNAEIISMPDKWEYPWYAAWDLAFHCVPLALVDAEFAKDQMKLLCREWYMHPNGQLPAYEWAFSDVNPPVHAWGTWRVFQIDRVQRRLRTGNKDEPGDIAFLESVFHKLLLNFTWWVNRKDEGGNNVFQGGFLGLDNIGLFDRSKPLPTGGYLNQADGTAWMAMYSLNLMRMALELACHNPVYQDIATKFFEHFLSIAEAITRFGKDGDGLWDENDGFFYDELFFPDGQGGGCEVPLKVRSMVGLIPMFAVEVIEPELLDKLPAFKERLEWVLENRPELAALVSHWEVPGQGQRRLLSLLRGHRLKCLIRKMMDPAEFLSAYGIRAMSKVHEDPYVFDFDGQRFEVDYQPAESNTYLFGGNSNWRGPIWFPVNYLIIESLQKFHHYYGVDFRVESPTGSGQYVTIDDVATDIGERLTRIFLRDPETGRRAVNGDVAKLQDDPHFRDLVLFFEYFHGDNGRGVGASHQTGWTGLVAKLLQRRRSVEEWRTQG